jgi:hypothetical protein
MEIIDGVQWWVGIILLDEMMIGVGKEVGQ